MRNNQQGIYEMPQNAASTHINDVHYSGGLFARIPHEFLKDVKDPIAIAVYNHLMMYADWNSGLAHPSRERLAKALEYKTTRPVDNAIKHLAEKGWIKTFPRWTKFDDETGRKYISYEAAEGFAQTSNGYVVYDRKQQADAETDKIKGGASQETRGGACSTPPQVPEGYTNKNHLNKNQLTNKDMLISGEKSVTTPQHKESDKPEKQDTHSSQKKTPDQKYPQDFLEWYSIYPRKKAKGDALKAYKQVADEVEHEELMERTRKFARYVEQSETQQHFVPYPATWLRAAQWEDELEPEMPQKRAETTRQAFQSTDPRGKTAEALLMEQWAREDAQRNNQNYNQPQSAIFEWPQHETKEIEQ